MTSIQNDLICLAEEVSSGQCIGTRTVDELNIKAKRKLAPSDVNPCSEDGVIKRALNKAVEVQYLHKLAYLHF